MHALQGKTVLITAGPTREPIDSVRYISNHSSGKMGYAIAREAALRGARVTVVSGPVSIPAPEGCSVVYVQTACEMEQAVLSRSTLSDIIICAAAVCDMRPKQVYDHKLKKAADAEALRTIEFVENPDILKQVGLSKKPGQVVVGFAAETDDLIAHAQSKLASKHADMIVANDVSTGKVFGSDTNKAMFITDAGIDDYPEMEKGQLACALLDKISTLLA